LGRISVSLFLVDAWARNPIQALRKSQFFLKYMPNFALPKPSRVLSICGHSTGFRASNDDEAIDPKRLKIEILKRKGNRSDKKMGINKVKIFIVGLK